jgi:hypothetical protein
MLSAFSDIINSPHYEIQMFLLFTVIFIIVPTVGGVLVLIYDFLAAGKKIPRAYCMFPFVGSCYQFFTDPLVFFSKQAPIFTLDLLKQEFAVILDADISQKVMEKDPGAAYVQSQMSKLIHKNYNPDDLSHLLCNYLKNVKSFDVADCINDVIINANNCDLFTICSRVSVASLITICLGKDVYFKLTIVL